MLIKMVVFAVLRSFVALAVVTSASAWTFSRVAEAAPKSRCRRVRPACPEQFCLMDFMGFTLGLISCSVVKGEIEFVQ